MARGSARAGRDCVAVLVSLIPDRAAACSLAPSLPPPLTTRPPPLQADSYLFDVRLLFASPSPPLDGEDGSHRLRSTTTPQARLVLLLLYLADLQWRRHARLSRRESGWNRSDSVVPEIQTLNFRLNAVREMTNFGSIRRKWNIHRDSLSKCTASIILLATRGGIWIEWICYFYFNEAPLDLDMSIMYGSDSRARSGDGQRYIRFVNAEIDDGGLPFAEFLRILSAFADKRKFTNTRFSLNEQPIEGNSSADTSAAIIAGNHRVIIIEGKGKEVFSYLRGGGETCKRLLTNHLVRLDSYASVPRQGAWLECGAAALSRERVELAARVTRSGRTGTRDFRRE